MCCVVPNWLVNWAKLEDVTTPTSYSPISNIAHSSTPRQVGTSSPHFGETSTRAFCTSCQSDVDTAILRKDGAFTFLASCVLIYFRCGIFCCFIPFCLKSYKDTVHYCPVCSRELGRLKRI
ncbi:unnamed protein product [Rodentolepis nana]|uniref:LITAF domain-containing protein n=1 Tax=Rodentolepis nana TaxID=102285 RepID=A0A158QIL9_RODNA|nr:unnamed protein product [Rodentolepis nana]